MEIANKLEIHYYLANDEHSMNALVRNKCETELLAIFKEVCATFDIDLPVETLAGASKNLGTSVIGKIGLS